MTPDDCWRIALVSCASLRTSSSEAGAARERRTSLLALRSTRITTTLSAGQWYALLTRWRRLASFA